MPAVGRLWPSGDDDDGGDGDGDGDDDGDDDGEDDSDDNGDDDGDGYDIRIMVCEERTFCHEISSQAGQADEALVDDLMCILKVCKSLKI